MLVLCAYDFQKQPSLIKRNNDQILQTFETVSAGFEEFEC